MNRLINISIWFVKFCIVFIVLAAIAYYGAHAWIIEDEARAAKLQQHIYDVALGRGVYGPVAPTGLKPNYGDPSEPKTKVFQDAGRESTSGMGFDARKKERGK